MAINETIFKGRKWRVCIDKSAKKWNRYSYWTAASDVEFDDGSTLENRMSSMKGITKNIDSGDGYAADISLVKSIKTSLTNLITSLTNLVNSINNRLGGLRFYEDSNGKWVVGADSVPKKLGSSIMDYANAIVHVLPVTRNRDLGNINSTVSHIAEFDLSILPGYENFIFGENIVSLTVSYSPPQIMSHTTGMLMLNKLQYNIDSLDYNKVAITDFLEGGTYAPKLDNNDSIFVFDGESVKQQPIKVHENGINNPAYYRYSLYSLYVQNTGKLYIISFNSGYPTAISLYRL